MASCPSKGAAASKGWWYPVLDMLVAPKDGSIPLGMLVPPTPEMILLPPWECWYPKGMLLHSQG